MSKVHLFISSNSFNSEEEMDCYINPTYDENSEKINSKFMNEVIISNYEPMCIEATYEKKSMLLEKLLEGSSYFEQWSKNIPTSIQANMAVCVFEPNLIISPGKSTLRL